jgi:hypothetical protein
VSNPSSTDPTEELDCYIINTFIMFIYGTKIVRCDGRAIIVKYSLPSLFSDWPLVMDDTGYHERSP